MARPRNNIMKLSGLTRMRICKLLDDGATYDEIRSYPDVVEECAEKELMLHNRSFLAYRNGNEFDEYYLRSRKWNDDLQRNQIAAQYVTDADGSGNIANLADYQLMRICLKKLDSGEEIDSKELRSISGAVANYNRNRIAEEKEDGKRAAAEREAEYQAKIAQLSATVEAQSERLRNLAGGVDGTAVADAMNKNLGLDT